MLFQSFKLRSALALIVLAAGLASCKSPEEKAQAHFERGQQFAAQNDGIKATIEFKNALQLKKDHVDAWRALAAIEEQNQNWEGLAAILKTVIELAPKDIEARLRLARLMLLANALDDALKTITAASEVDGSHTGVLALRSAVLLKVNDREGALRDAKAVLAQEPANAEALTVLAAERLAANDATGALSLLSNPKIADSFGVELFKLRIYETLKDEAQIEATLKWFVERYPQERSFRRQLVKLFQDQKRPQDAQRELRSIAAAHPNDFEAGMDVVRYLHTFEGPVAARAELTTRIHAGGDVFRYQMALAEHYFREGNVADSVHFLENLAATLSSQEQALAAKARLADIHLVGKKMDAAEVLVTDILQKDSRNVNGLRLRASMRLERGELDGAITDLRQALNDQPRSVELMSQLAVVYERAGSIELADKQFADATRVSDFEANTGMRYAAFLKRRGSLARTEDILTGLANRWPADVAVLAALAEIRLVRQNWIGAQEIAEAIKRIGDTRGLSSQILAASLSAQKKFDQSIPLLEAAFSATSGTQPMFALVSTLLRAGQTERAGAFVQTVLAKDQNSAEAHVLMGTIHVEKKAFAEARKSFETAIDRQPKNTIGYRALADLLLRQNKPEEATVIVQKALNERADSGILRLQLASALEAKGDFDAAIGAYEDLLKAQPGSLVAANNLASLLSDYKTDKPSLERAHALAASLRKSQVPQFKDTLGWVLYRRGDFKAAVLLLEEAANELPSLAMVRYHLGAAYAASGQTSKAMEQLKKAIELGPPNAEIGEKIRIALQQPAAN